jgi:ABC-type polysaccharide/polyol phosphate export permease
MEAAVYLPARLRELLDYRELVRNLVVRDLKLRYRNSALGFLWCLLNPLLMMTVFTVVFTVLLPNNTIEKFPVFILTGILAWQLHTAGLVGAVNSVVAHAGLIQRVYFPREVLPIASVLSNAVNFVLSLVALFVMLVLYQVPLTPVLLLLPVVILVQVMFTTGIGLLLAAVNVYYRDTSTIMESLMLAWFFLTPIFYRIEDVFPVYSRLMYILNPPASFIAAYRDILYYGVVTDWTFFSRTAATSCLVLLVGYIVFARLSRSFAEAL